MILASLLMSLLPAQVGQQCVPCHPKETAAYNRTAMAHSLSRRLDQPSGNFLHTASGSRFRIASSPAGMKQSVERDGYKAEYPVDYVIGSGNHAFGYLVRVNGYLFQSPLSFYSRRKIWDVAPGYEGNREPDFTRPVSAECLVCHSGQPRPVYGTLNRYGDPPFAAEAIGCERCHGPAVAHLKSPAGGNIVNPAKLAARPRDSVCEQCHLGGEARVPNPGRRIAEFTPGQELEQVFSVYLYEQPPSGLKVVSHVEQLALSRCAIRSEGKLWCGTCHNPHEAADFDARCRSCHATPGAAIHSGAKQSCTACHMPKRQARDGGHTAFTEHRIARRPSLETASASTARELKPWKPAATGLSERGLGLANVIVGDRDRSAYHLDAGYRLLADLPEPLADDPSVATSLGLVLLRKNRPAEASQFYRRALERQPDYAPYHVNLATALEQSGQLDEAAAQLERALKADPSLEQAYLKLAAIQTRRGAKAGARATLDRLLRFMPGHLAGQIARDLE